MTKQFLAAIINIELIASRSKRMPAEVPIPTEMQIRSVVFFESYALGEREVFSVRNLAVM
ncbi:hypothetical protein [Schlesneria paludicola]|uniref:hypothetical protein n=1 Tax=Schlesneria paludicola TaxID=360056 RepID=UPI0012FBC679|nr:hypothetical protein [Schlesneria paludicola]